MNTDTLHLTDSAFYLAVLPGDSEGEPIFDVITAADAGRLMQAGVTDWQLQPTDRDTPTACYCPECRTLHDYEPAYKRLEHRLCILFGKDVGGAMVEPLVNADPFAFQTGDMFSMPSAELVNLVLSMLARRAEMQAGDGAPVQVCKLHTCSTPDPPHGFDKMTNPTPPRRPDDDNIVRIFPAAILPDQDDDAGPTEMIPTPRPSSAVGEGNLEEVIRRYLEDRYASGCRDTSVAGYAHHLKHLTSFLMSEGVANAEDITPEHVIRYLAHKRSDGNADSTLVTIRRTILIFLKWASELGICCEAEWSKRVRKGKVDKKEPRCLTPEETARLVAACDKLNREETLSRFRDKAMVLTLLDSALRASDLLGMHMSDLNLEDHSIRVRASAKSRKERTVWFGELAKRALVEYLKLRQDAGPEDFLWISRYKKKLGYQRLLNIIKEVSAIAGLDSVTVHTTRHSCCTNLLRGGMSVKHVQMIMGHCDVKITDQYTHLLPSDVEKLYRQGSPVDRLQPEGE